MVDYLKRVSGQILDFLKNLSPARKVAAFAVTSVVMAGLTAMFFWAGDQTYQSLMTNLNPEDSANIMRILREKKIPFRVDSSGKNISIPPENVLDFRLELAQLGLPQSSVVGYEIFDKQSLGQTSFVQKVNQKRALEGELMRTIGQIRGVRRSRVHLAIPQKSAFVEDQKKPTASVHVDLDPSAQLNEKQIFGIANLVARAVEGMEIGDVVIVDGNGKTLSKNASDPLAAATASQHDFRQKVEHDLKDKIEKIMARVVGEGRVEATVSAEIDFSQVQETQTTFDQDGSAVRSQETDSKQMEMARPGPQGLAGVQSNTPGQPPSVNGTRSDTKTIREVKNYDVPQTVRRVVRPSWEVKRLSVAVVVDGKQIRVPASADGAPSTKKSESWSPEKLKEFEAIVSSTVGLDRKRGDILEVKNMDFSREDFDEATRIIAENERKSYIQNLVIYGVIGLVIVLFFLLVVRPFIKWFTDNTVESVDSFLPQTIEELEKMQKGAVLQSFEESVPVVPERIDPDKVEGEMMKEKIITLIDANPHKAALILKDWLHGEKNKPRPAADEGAKDAGKGKTA